MNLISKEAVLDGIDKYIEKAQSTGTEDDFISFEELVVKALPSAFEGMTNGEVMNLVLRKVFPRTIFIRGIDEYNKTKSIVYSEEWENAPYQKGGE